ncbi:DUF7848 domain-containing protein [Streptomyces sp. NPDC001393]
MSPRAVYRFVPHTIRHVLAEATCFECEATSGPTGNPDVAQDWALAHTGRTLNADDHRQSSASSATPVIRCSG